MLCITKYQCNKITSKCINNQWNFKERKLIEFYLRLSLMKLLNKLKLFKFAIQIWIAQIDCSKVFIVIHVRDWNLWDLKIGNSLFK